MQSKTLNKREWLVGAMSWGWAWLWRSECSGKHSEVSGWWHGKEIVTVVCVIQTASCFGISILGTSLICGALFLAQHVAGRPLGLHVQASVLSLDTVLKHSWKTWIKNRLRYRTIFGLLGLPVAALLLNSWHSAFHLRCWVAWFLPPSWFTLVLLSLMETPSTVSCKGRC